MSVPVVLTPEAAGDFDGASNWYQEQVSLGMAFTANVRDVPGRIEAAPEHHPVVYRDVRRVQVKRFPYIVYFRAGSQRVEVTAILHARRDPSAWKKRV